MESVHVTEPKPVPRPRPKSTGAKDTAPVSPAEVAPEDNHVCQEKVKVKPPPPPRVRKPVPPRSAAAETDLCTDVRPVVAQASFGDCDSGPGQTPARSLVTEDVTEGTTLTAAEPQPRPKPRPRPASAEGTTGGASSNAEQQPSNTTHPHAESEAKSAPLDEIRPQRPPPPTARPRSTSHTDSHDAPNRSLQSKPSRPEVGPKRLPSRTLASTSSMPAGPSMRPTSGPAVTRPRHNSQYDEVRAANPPQGPRAHEPQAVALEDFVPRMPDELEFFRDERIYLVRRVDTDWFEGEVVSGERGLVPANLLLVQVPLSDGTDREYAGSTSQETRPHAIATVDWDGDQPGDLGFRTGDLILLKEQKNENWLVGIHSTTDTVGEFPATFVRVVVPLPVVDRADPDTPGESHSGKPAKPAIPSRPAKAPAMKAAPLVTPKQGGLNHVFQPTQRKPTVARPDQGFVVVEDTTVPAATPGSPDVAFEWLELYEDIDEHARNSEPHHCGDVVSLAKYLCEPFQHSERYRFRSIFAWMAFENLFREYAIWLHENRGCYPIGLLDDVTVFRRCLMQNIAYNHDMLLNRGRYPMGDEPSEVLRTRRAVCEGYARLFDELAHAAGLQSRKIVGHSKGGGYIVGNDPLYGPGHAWNMVKIAGVDYLIDACWGAGHVKDGTFAFEFNPHYFLAPPDVFVTDHLPADPRDQLMQPALTKDDFTYIPTPRGVYYENRCYLLSHVESCVIEAPNGTVLVEIETGGIIWQANAEITCQELGIIRDSSYCFCQFSMAGRTRNLQVFARFPLPGRYQLTRDAGEAPKLNQSQPQALRQMVTYAVDVEEGSSLAFPTPYAKFYSEKLRLIEPFFSPLKVGQQYSICLEKVCPGIDDDSQLGLHYGGQVIDFICNRVGQYEARMDMRHAGPCLVVLVKRTRAGNSMSMSMEGLLQFMCE